MFLVCGASGLVGFQLCNLFDKLNIDYYGTYNSRKIDKTNMIKVNFFNPEEIEELLTSKKIKCCIFSIVERVTDTCENDWNAIKNTNINMVNTVSYLCNKLDIKFIHISTDYVFDGKSGPYNEDDPLNPISIYGKTKLASEHILLEEDTKHLVIRGNVLYDYSPHTSASFLNWVVSSLKGNQEIKVVEDQFNNPTWTRSMSDIIELSIENDLEGIIHWGDSEHISRFEFAKLIAKKFSLNDSLIKPVLTSELNQPARRPLQSGLSTEKLVNMLDIIPPSIEDCLDEIIKTAL